MAQKRRGVKPKPWTDDELLRALLMEADGMNKAEIGRQLGRSRSSVERQLYKVRQELEASEA